MALGFIKRVFSFGKKKTVETPAEADGAAPADEELIPEAAAPAEVAEPVEPVGAETIAKAAEPPTPEPESLSLS